LKVFISWSGERSQALAKAIHSWLPLVLHYVEPWLSHSDIDAGERWGVEVAKELDASAFGITCITSENVTSPWILFEAGALAKSMKEGQLVPLLFDIEFKDISGPLAQFQAKKVEKAGILDVVSAVNRAANSPEPDLRITTLFEALWPTLEQSIATIPANAAPQRHARPQAEVLEELVSSVRNLDLRYRDEWDDGYPSRSKRSKRRMMLLEDTLHFGMKEVDGPLQILIAGSLFKDEMPWVYELCRDIYTNMRAGNFSAAKSSARAAMRTVEMIGRGPWMEETDGRSMHLLMRELDRLSNRGAYPTLEEQEQKPIRKRTRLASKPAAE
jgi:hypothetical protein